MSAPFSTNRSDSPRRSAAAGSATSLGRTGSVTSVLAADRLTALEVLSFLGTSIAPLTVVAGVISTGWLVTGITGFPLAFLLVGLTLALFSVGYVSVAQHLRNAGAFYTYVAAGLGKPFGVGASFVALIAYGMMSIATYGAIGPTAAGLIKDKTGADVSWWVVALVVWLIVAILGVARVDLNGKILSYALTAELLLVVVLDFIDVGHPHNGSFALSTWTPSALSGDGLGVALAIAVTAFIGFEGAAVFSEEAKSHARTVRRATYWSLGIMTTVYALSAWAMTVTIGADQLQPVAQKNGVMTPFVAAGNVPGGSLLLDLGQVLFLTSLFAAALAFHNTTARYGFALGRERVLPSFLGRTAAQNNAPRAASVVQSVIALVVIVTYTLNGADPLVKLFYWGGTTGGFGVLCLITATSFAVFGYFLRNTAHRDGTWRSFVAPMAAGLLLLGVIVLIWRNFAAFLGVEPTSSLSWMLPSMFILLAALGIVWALLLRAVRPSVYAAIGLGAPASALTLRIDEPSEPQPPADQRWTGAGR
jgi:amino acid transporter